jgi:hypothetical protein
MLKQPPGLVSLSRKLSGNQRSGRKLTFPNASAGHPRRWIGEREPAPHVSRRSLEVGQDLAGVMRDKSFTRTPKAPAAKTPTAGPTGPQRPHLIDDRILCDLEERSLIDRAVTEACGHRATSSRFSLPRECGSLAARNGFARSRTSSRAAPECQGQSGGRGANPSSQFRLLSSIWQGVAEAAARIVPVCSWNYDEVISEALSDKGRGLRHVATFAPMNVVVRSRGQQSASHVRVGGHANPEFARAVCFRTGRTKNLSRIWLRY